MNMASHLPVLSFRRILRRIALAALALGAAVAQAQPAPALGEAENFAVLAGSAVTNTGGTLLTGDLGIWPNTASSITGFPPGVVDGVVHAGDAVAQQAQSDLTTAYDALAGRACDTVLTGTNLGGLTLTPGTYCFSTSAQLTGTLTLDAQGDTDAVFVFQISSTLTTASNASVSIINGGSDCNVFWQVGSSATLGTATNFAGNILALSSITATTGASLSGRALARNGAVTLDTNNVAVCPTCALIALAPATLPNGILGVGYSQTIAASGGEAPYAYSLITGALPPGLLLSSATGEVSGTPIEAGSFTFTVSAADAVGCFGSRVYTIVINGPACPEILLSPQTLPATVLGTPYSQTLVASGGAAPYTYMVSSGALPPGLALDPASGVLSGTPNAPGSFTFTVTATDANGCFGSRIYSVIVDAPVCPVIAVAPTALPAMLAGMPYSQSIVASGGTAPYVYSVTTGVLPPGLTLASATGLLSGTPATAGNYGFSVTATDTAGCAGTRAYGAEAGLSPAVSVPGSSAWGLAALALLFGLSGLVALRR